MQTHVARSLLRSNVKHCDKNKLEKKLKEYDAQLYLEFNKEKECWELRRLPDFKYTFLIGKYQGKNVFMTHYVENTDINLVYDLPILSMDVLRRIREGDTWTNPDLNKSIENYDSELLYRETKYKEELEAKNKKDLKYNIRQNRKYFADLKEEVRSGRLNPFDVFNNFQQPKRR